MSFGPSKSLKMASSVSEKSRPSPASPRLPSPPPFPEVQIPAGSTTNSKSNTTATATNSSIAPRRIRPGTKSKNIATGPPLVPLNELESAFQLQEHLAALLSSITSSPDSDTTIPLSREACATIATPPEGAEESLWCYELTRRLTRDLNVLLVALLNDNCTASSCPEMRASEWQYLCAVHDPPKSCCAIDYSTHTLDQAATMLCTQKYFPSRLNLGPGSIKHLGSIFRRLYRIFAHAWFQHRSVFWDVENEFGLYLFFKTVSDRYHLIPKDNLTLPPEAEGLKSTDEEADFDEEEEIDEFDRGTGERGQRQQLSGELEEDDGDEDYPDSDESESDEDEEGELRNGEDDEDDEFEPGMDIHLLEDEKSELAGIENNIDEKDEDEQDSEEIVERSLLLLPTPPENATLAGLKSLYTPSLAAAFQQTPSDVYSILDIAIHAPFLSSPATISRRKLFTKTQRLLARLYSAAYSAAIKEGREDLVDVRIIFLSDTGLSFEEEKKIPTGIFNGPIVSLRKLADSGRKWKNIIIASPPPTEGEEDGEGEGEVIANHFLGYYRDHIRTNTGVLRCDLGDTPENSEEEEGPNEKEPEDGEEHSIVAVGGTFDHLHPGHKLLLTMTAFILSPQAPSPRLIIGITGANMLKNKKYSKYITPWSTRTHQTIQFLRGILDFSSSDGVKSDTTSSMTPETETTLRAFTTLFAGTLVVETVEIDDPFGPTITNADISALVVSKESSQGGESVNTKRLEAGFKELEVFSVDVIDTDAEGMKMSSTDIRKRLEEKDAIEN